MPFLGEEERVRLGEVWTGRGTKMENGGPRLRLHAIVAAEADPRGRIGAFGDDRRTQRQRMTLTLLCVWLTTLNERKGPKHKSR
jgi:hypothetical protein